MERAPAIGGIAFAEMLALALGLAQSIRISTIGQVFGGEVLAFAVLPALLLVPGAARRVAQAKWFYFFALLWFAGAVATDYYRDTSFGDYVRGWARIVFLTVDFTVVWLLVADRPRALMFLIAGLSVSLIGYGIFPVSEYIESDPWKFAIGLGFLLATIPVSNSRASRLVFGTASSAAWLMIVAAISLYFNTRAIFGIATMAALYSFVAEYIRERPDLIKRVTPTVFGLLLLAGIFTGQLMISGYGVLAQAGVLGEGAATKYKLQTAGDVGVNVFLGGRLDTFVAMRAIADSPILGHGSWAKDRYYVNLLADMLMRYGMSTEGQTGLGSDEIPSHSHLMNAWVESGILGGLFWIWVLTLVIRTAYFVLRTRSLPSMMVVLTIFWLLWDILFSPLAAEHRLLRGMQISIIMIVIRTIDMNKAAAKKQRRARARLRRLAPPKRRLATGPLASARSKGE